MLHRPYFNGADGMILVFDVARSSTFSNINNWYSTAVKYGLSGIPRILVGIRKGINSEEQRKIILPMAEHLSEKLNAPYFETSLVTGENIDLIFHKIAELIYEAKKSQNNRDNNRYDPMIHEKTEGFHNRRYNAYIKQGIPKRRDYISSRRF